MLDLERDAGAFAQLPPGRFPPIEAADYDPLVASRCPAWKFPSPADRAGLEELGGALAAGARIVVGFEHI